MGTARMEHRFQFRADTIAGAASEQAAWHRGRQAYWQQEQTHAEQVVKQEARIVIKRFPVTGGERIDVVVDYGDPTAYRRLTEAFDKIQKHVAAAQTYESEAMLYGTQRDRVYELDIEDVHHFRLAGEAKPE